jgi:23S rRNA (guanosine2251-2'-O)-methyltransferase
MVVSGRHAVREALRGPRAVSGVWATAAAARERWLATARAPVEVVAPEDLRRRCATEDHQGVCADVAPYGYAAPSDLLAGGDPFLVALDQVQDPHNLGAVCRSAECAGVDGVVLCERRAAHVTPAVCRASAGAVEHLRIARAVNLAGFLVKARDAGCWVYGATAPGAGQENRPPLAYDAPDYRGGVVLVLGAEARGLRPRVAGACDALVTLPLRGRVRSLNVAAAGTALMYEILQQRLAP